MPNTKFSPYILFILVVTVCYLCVELAFNATLLDVCAGTGSIDDIDSVEFYGRVISGFAVA